MTPVKFKTPSKISINATQNSIDNPSLGGITTPKIIIADPTKKMVSVCPNPHSSPIAAERRTDPCRLTMVDTATTWSGSVEWRIPRNNPSNTTVTNGTSLSGEISPCLNPTDPIADNVMPAPNTTINADDKSGR